MNLYIVKELDWGIDIVHGIFTNLELAEACFNSKASEPLEYGDILQIVETTADTVDPDMKVLKNLGGDD